MTSSSKWTRSLCKYACFFMEKGPSLAVFQSPVDKVERAEVCQLIVHGSATNAHIRCGCIIMELSEPFLGSRLWTAYEKTPIKQLSLKVGARSLISAPKKQRERTHRRMTANSESGGLKGIKARIKMKRTCRYIRLWKITAAEMKMSASCQGRLWFLYASCGHWYHFAAHVHSGSVTLKFNSL